MNKKLIALAILPANASGVVEITAGKKSKHRPANTGRPAAPLRK